MDRRFPSYAEWQQGQIDRAGLGESGEQLRPLIDLRDRLVRATETIDDLRNKAAALHNLTEHARLAGKLEGVRLALSYLDESIGR